MSSSATRSSRPPTALLIALGIICVWAISQSFFPGWGDVRDADNDAPVATDIATARVQQRQAERDQLLDPSQDGWGTEAFADKATRQLKTLAKILSHPEMLSGETVKKIAAEDFRCGPLRPWQLTTVFDGPMLTVRRPTTTEDAGAPPATDSGSHEGPAGLAAAVREMIAGLEPVSEPQVAVKVFFIELTEEEAATRVYIQSDAETKNGHAQQNATWRCRWRLPEDGSLPLLLDISVLEYEETAFVRSESGSLFADYTEAGLGQNESYQQQLGYGNHYWGSVIDRLAGIRLRGYHGMAIGDVNGDGLEDAYVCEPGGLPNLLYIQSEDGTLRDVSKSAGVDFLDPASSALFVDLDNDGDQDLVIASINAIAILANDGNGRFEIRTLLDGGEAFQPTAADYDADGDLDLYIPMYEPFGHEDTVIAGAPIAIPYHDANNGKPNVLYRNDGKWRFTDVTEVVGLDQNNSKFTLAATWEDIDLDGDQDLYVANDFGRNNLYRYDGETGRFTDIAATAGVEDMSTGMSASFGDYNRDGLPDLYVSNMWSSAGNRITYQRQFRDEQEVKDEFQYLARGNSLFENAGDNTFRDVSIASGITMGRWAWGSVFADINNDGWDDILVANGYITGSNSGDL